MPQKSSAHKRPRSEASTSRHAASTPAPPPTATPPPRPLQYERQVLLNPYIPDLPTQGWIKARPDWVNYFTRIASTTGNVHHLVHEDAVREFYLNGTIEDHEDQEQVAIRSLVCGTPLRIRAADIARAMGCERGTIRHPDFSGYTLPMHRIVTGRLTGSPIGPCLTTYLQAISMLPEFRFAFLIFQHDVWSARKEKVDRTMTELLYVFGDETRRGDLDLPSFVFGRMKQMLVGRKDERLPYPFILERIFQTSGVRFPEHARLSRGLGPIGVDAFNRMIAHTRIHTWPQARRAEEQAEPPTSQPTQQPPWESIQQHITDLTSHVQEIRVTQQQILATQQAYQESQNAITLRLDSIVDFLHDWRFPPTDDGDGDD